MKINIAPSIDQIRFYARSAMHAWDILPENARETVMADMAALLRYLDACENGSGRIILGVAKIERGIRLKISWADPQVVDLTDQYADDRNAPNGPGNGQPSVFGDIEDVRSHCDGSAPDAEIDFEPVPHRGTQR